MPRTSTRHLLIATLVMVTIVTITATLAATRPTLPRASPSPAASERCWYSAAPQPGPSRLVLHCPPNDAQTSFLPRPSGPQRCWGTDDRAYQRQPDGAWVPSAARNPIDSATYPSCPPSVGRTSTNTRSTPTSPQTGSQGHREAFYATA
jgi:hypothetical protein